HRIGRTARAGNMGTAISLCASDERGFLSSIEKLIRKKIKVSQTPDGLITEVKNLSRFANPRGPKPNPKKVSRPSFSSKSSNNNHRPQSHGNQAHSDVIQILHIGR